MPAYNDTPLAAQRKNDSQPLIQTNFTTLKTYLEQDHSIITGSGKHKQVTLPVLGAVPATLANELAVYSKTVNATTQLYMKRNEDLVEVPLTGQIHTGVMSWAMLPGGVKLRWGHGITPAGGVTPIINLNAVDAALAFTETPHVTVSRAHNCFADTDVDITNLHVYVNTITYVNPANCNLILRGGRSSSDNDAAVGYIYFAVGI
jgi:hypothetical protein